MQKYLFITYGEPGWRGVQVRALRIAKYLPVEEVIFWNMYDSKFIEDAGFSVEKKFSGITLSADIFFPKEIEIVIFADLPSNEFFQFAVYQKALSVGLKIVICEQLYRRGQVREGVFKTFAKNSDLFLLNSLSFLKTEEAENIKIIPPQIEFTPSASARADVRKLYFVPKDAFLFVGIGYHPEVLEKIKIITKKLEEQHLPIHTIIVGGDKIVDKGGEKNLTIIPFAKDEKYVDLLAASDAVFCKFGFLQILETLALGKPTIVLGEGGFLLKNEKILDLVYKEVLRFEQDITSETYGYFEKLITDYNFRKEIEKRIKKLHDGELFGGKIAAAEIKKLTLRKVKQPVKKIKKLVILVNDEVFEKKEQFSGQDIYSLSLILAMPTEDPIIKRVPEGIYEKSLGELLSLKKDEILPYAFSHVIVLSQRKADGLVIISPWYDIWLLQINELIAAADEIFVSSSTAKLFSVLMGKNKKANITVFNS